MKTNASSANDTRLRETLDVIAKLASGDLDARVAPSRRGDDLDGVMTGLNVLAEQMSYEIGERKRAKEGLRKSEEKLTAFMDNLPGTAFLKDASGGYTYVNRMYEDAFGIKQAEWLGKTDEELFPPDIAEQYRSNDRKVLETGRPVHTIEPALREGDVRHWLAYKFPIFDEAGVPVIVGGIGLDVTEYERSKERLRESEERYRALVEAAGDAIYMKDAQGRYTTVNPEFERVAGKSSSELEGKTARDMFSAPVGDEAFRVDMEILNTGVTLETEGELRTQAGPRTYLTRKVPTRDWSGQVVGLVGISRDITERTRAETELRESEERYRVLVEAAGDSIYVKDAQGCYTFVNSEFERRFARFGLKASGKDEIYGKTSSELFGGPLGAKAREADMEVLKTGIPVETELEVPTEDGSVTHFSRKVPLKDENGQVIGLLGISRDITERKHLQEQLIHAQKMESVGRLAGGVAHDFNNMLTVIINYTHLATTRASGSGAVGEYLREVQVAAERASRLTSQLLAFSRRQVIAPRVLDLNDIIADTSNMLRRLIGEDVELVTLLGVELGLVNVDPGQMEQVLLNLAINAQDAMPEGGKLTIETVKVRLDQDSFMVDPTLAAGDYVMLSVSDNGVGMTDEVRSHIFEPFYTTKEVGKGTGLGLSTCYGIVAQNGGGIEVRSELGQGTTVQVYLPRVEARLQSLPLRDEEGYLPVGSETVLVVEDEPLVRGVTAEMLRAQGYKVMEAANGTEAISVAEEVDDPVGLLLTDVVMPLMGGLDLAERLRKLHPQTRVLYMSGYVDDDLVQQQVSQDQGAFLQKPFTAHALAHRVRETLDRELV